MDSTFSFEIEIVILKILGSLKYSVQYYVCLEILLSSQFIKKIIWQFYISDIAEDILGFGTLYLSD